MAEWNLKYLAHKEFQNKLASGFEGKLLQYVKYNELI